MLLSTRRGPLAGALLLVLAIDNPVAASGPNIIHIIADDLGWTDLSSGLTNKGNGSAFYQTPNIDRLAAEGMAFTSAYAAQTCVPTRIALMTGQYATRTRAYNVTPITGSDSDPLLGATTTTNIDTAAVTVGETLQTAGYTTAHFGKFHTTQDAADITAEHGFDFNYGGGTSGGPGSYFAGTNGRFGNSIGPGLDPYAASYTQAYVDANLKAYANGADVDSLVGTPKHLSDAMADAAIDFIGDRVAADEGPFYMNVAFNAVHTTVESRPDLETKYNDLLADSGGTSPDPRHGSAPYAGLLEGMDQAVGRLIDYLGDPNGDGNPADSLAENTVVIFYGDNGATQVSSSAPLSGSKGSQSEGGLRVPLIAWSPGLVANGVTDEPVHAVDFYPTFAEYAGASTPDPTVQPIDGESLTGLLAGQTTKTNRDAVFFHLPGYAAQDSPSSTAIADLGGARRKLMYSYERRDFQFFDLDNDLGEANDLANGDLSPTEYKRAARATRGLREWLDETGAVYPTVRADGTPVPPPSHLPGVRFDFAGEVDGLQSAEASKLGIDVQIVAAGQNATLIAVTGGVGVASDVDTGGVDQQGRINGTLSTPEAIELSFSTDVMLKSLLLAALSTNGSEAVTLSLVSGENPFTGLLGYDADGFLLGEDSLSFAAMSADSSSFELDFGVLGRDELLIEAGTVLSLSADPAVGGGILLEGLTVAQPLSAVEHVLLDYNLDGSLDTDDFAVWRATYGSTTDLRADGNGDGLVDAADYTRLCDAVAPNLTAAAVPEPATAGLLLIVLAGCLTRSGPRPHVPPSPLDRGR